MRAALRSFAEKSSSQLSESQTEYHHIIPQASPPIPTDGERERGRERGGGENDRGGMDRERKGREGRIETGGEREREQREG